MFSNTSEYNQVITINNQISLNHEDLIEIYEVPTTSEWILENNFQKIGLQFPDDLLPIATPITNILEDKTGRKCVILGDTSFGSCCVDIVAGQHYNVDAIVHYGGACLTNTISLPVKYVFGNETTSSIEDILPSVLDNISSEERLCILYDFQFSSVVHSLSKSLSENYFIILTWPCLPEYKSKLAADNPITKCARYFDSTTEEEINSSVLIYIGEEGLSLDNILLNLSQCKNFYSINPITKTMKSEYVRLGSLIKRRRFLIEKCKDAQRVGILVGSLSVKNYLTCIDYLRVCIKSAGKCSYTFVVGKLNIAKLANFPEIDVFVLVACPENVLIPSREYYKPIVTPFEMELACNTHQNWITQSYQSDFNVFLPGGAWHLPMSSQNFQDTNDFPDVSLISGNIRSVPLCRSEGNSREGAVMLRSDLQVASIQKQEKSWHGLDPKMGETPVGGIVKGRKGIAIGYEDEMERDT